MNKKDFFFTFVLFWGLVSRSVFAMTASPATIELSQPDGLRVILHIRGDEWFHWYEDTAGYTVVRDNGRYAYAQLGADDRLAPTQQTVGRNNPKAAGLQKRILPPAGVRRAMRPQLLDGATEATAIQAVPPAGVVKNLVILCKFSNHTEGVHTRPAADYNVLFNQIGGHPTLAPTGSVKDLYLENSYGQMTLQSTIVGWVTLPNTESYYANNQDGLGNYPRNAQKMVEDALELADPLVDFDQFDTDNDGMIDAIDIIHSGYGAETGGGGGNWIWSHRWSVPWPFWTSDEGVKVGGYHTEPALWGTSGTGIVRFGVIAHETGHFFGLPDLYDADGSGEGIGSWGMMANAWGFDYSQLHPPHFCAWSKIFLGWVTPTVIVASGSFTIDQAETSPQIYLIDNGYPLDEYLLIENRRPAGIETTIPQGGLCIYHIDEEAGFNTEGYPGQAGWPTNGNHYRVALLQADGNYNLEKGQNRGDRYDVYRGGGVSSIGPGPGNHPNTDAYQDGIISVSDNRIHSISASSATMSFVYDNGSAALYTLSVYSAGVSGVAISSSTGHNGITNYSTTVNEGTTVTLTAPATAGGATFTGWTGAVTSSNQTISFSMNADMSVTANYETISTTTYPLYVYSSGASGVPISSSTGHGGTTFYSKTVDEGTTVSLTAPAAWDGKSFTRWSGSIISFSRTISLTMNAMKYVIAYYETTTPTIYTLNVYSSGTSGVAISSSTGHGGTTNYTKTVNESTMVTLTAPATSGGATFTGWTGSVSSSNQTISFSMNANKTVTANYETVTTGKTLSVSSSGVNSVPISSTTGCGGTTNYNQTVNDGALVILTAPMSWNGASFNGWTGSVSSSNATIWFIMDTNKSVTANYSISTPTTYTLNVYSSGASGVPISSSTGHSGTTNYSATVVEGTTVTLTAPATAGGATFTGWTGAVTSSSQTISLSMNSDKLVTANYEPDTGCVALTVSVDSMVADTQRGSRGRSFGEVTVMVIDNCGNAVSNAVVYGAFSGDFSDALIATTNTQGIATFTTTTEVKKPAYNFCVDDIVKGGLVYNPADNAQTCVSY